MVCKLRVFIRLGALPQVKFVIPKRLSLNSSCKRSYNDKSHGLLLRGFRLLSVLIFSPDLRIAIWVGRSGSFLWFPGGLCSVSGLHMPGFGSSMSETRDVGTHSGVWWECASGLHVKPGYPNGSSLNALPRHMPDLHLCASSVSFVCREPSGKSLRPGSQDFDAELTPDRRPSGNNSRDARLSVRIRP